MTNVEHLSFGAQTELGCAVCAIESEGARVAPGPGPGAVVLVAGTSACPGHVEEAASLVAGPGTARVRRGLDSIRSRAATPATLPPPAPPYDRPVG